VGPHGLVVGATGSGSSVLLRAWFVGLAMTGARGLAGVGVAGFRGGGGVAGCGGRGVAGVAGVGG
jgi:hypothetical protein